MSLILKNLKAELKQLSSEAEEAAAQSIAQQHLAELPAEVRAILETVPERARLAARDGGRELLVHTFAPWSSFTSCPRAFKPWFNPELFTPDTLLGHARMVYDELSAEFEVKLVNTSQLYKVGAQFQMLICW